MNTFSYINAYAKLFLGDPKLPQAHYADDSRTPMDDIDHIRRHTDRVYDHNVSDDTPCDSDLEPLKAKVEQNKVLCIIPMAVGILVFGALIVIGVLTGGVNSDPGTAAFAGGFTFLLLGTVLTAVISSLANRTAKFYMHLLSAYNTDVFLLDDGVVAATVCNFTHDGRPVCPGGMLKTPDGVVQADFLFNVCVYIHSISGIEPMPGHDVLLVRCSGVKYTVCRPASRYWRYLRTDFANIEIPLPMYKHDEKYKAALEKLKK